MPARPCIVSVSPVTRAILDDFAARDTRIARSPQDLRMVEVLIDQILGSLGAQASYLPFAASSQLNGILDELHRNPGDRRSTGELAASIHTTARTLERRCRRELGMPLNEWRQRLKLISAIEALEAGKTVQQIAHELGYATTSAFIAMFRRATGTTPEQYRLFKRS